MIYGKDKAQVNRTDVRLRTDLSSASLVGVGHVPGSRVIARKKLYAQRPNDNAKIRWVNGCDSVSINQFLEE